MSTTLKPALRWHTTVLIVLLAVWGVWSLIGVPLALRDAAQSFPMGFFDRCLFLSMPMLLLISAWLLWVRSSAVLVVLVLLIVVYALAPLRVYLKLQAQGAVYYFEELSFTEVARPYLYAIGFFIACCIYCRHLWKRKLIS